MSEEGREVIVQLGDRRNSGFCLSCGTSLIVPYNDYQCCPNCTLMIEENLNIFRHKRKKQKKVGTVQVQSKQILRQVAPIGETIK